MNEPTKGDWLMQAENDLCRVGGFDGNGIADLGPAAIASALIAIGYELRQIRLLLSADTEAPK